MIENDFNIPSYTYRHECEENSLLQGDVLKVQGQFREYFTKFYPEVTAPDYVMILTQSCDLVRNQKRKPKLNHINVCLIKNFKAFILVLIREIKPALIANTHILEKDSLDRLKAKISKLLNNSDQKTDFFLPLKSPFTENMVAIIPLSFSFRIDHYDLLLKNRVLGLKSEFQAKIGNIISQLYGRIGTPDLFDFNWNDRHTRDYINTLLVDLNIKQVPDKGYIEYIKNNSDNSTLDIDELIQEYEAQRVHELFRPLKNELMQNLKNNLIKLFEDKQKINNFAQMDKKELSKEMKIFLQSIPQNSLVA